MRWVGWQRSDDEAPLLSPREIEMETIVPRPDVQFPRPAMQARIPPYVMVRSHSSSLLTAGHRVEVGGEYAVMSVNAWELRILSVILPMWSAHRLGDNAVEHLSTCRMLSTDLIAGPSLFAQVHHLR